MPSTKQQQSVGNTAKNEVSQTYDRNCLLITCFVAKYASDILNQNTQICSRDYCTLPRHIYLSAAVLPGPPHLAEHLWGERGTSLAEVPGRRPEEMDVERCSWLNGRLHLHPQNWIGLETSNMDKGGSGDWEGLSSSIWLCSALFLYTRHSVASTEVQPQASYMFLYFSRRIQVPTPNLASNTYHINSTWILISLRATDWVQETSSLLWIQKHQWQANHWCKWTFITFPSALHLLQSKCCQLQRALVSVLLPIRCQKKIRKIHTSQ